MTQQKRIFVTVAMLLMTVLSASMLESAEPRTIRIGVYVRSGFEACLERWTPMAEKLALDIQGHRFVIVPLASREDIFDALKQEKLDFLVANPAIYVCVEERFGVSAMCGMTSDEDPSGSNSTGCLIRSSSRTDLETIEDLRDARLSAVKPWSFAGWLMQWRVLQQHDIDPFQDMPPISYEGTHEEVIQSVLNNTADVGAVATDLLQKQIETGKVDPKSLSVFDTHGNAVPVGRSVVASTPAYPDWVFAKAAKTTDPMAEKVLGVLLSSGHVVQAGGNAGSDFAWTIPQNYHSVRETLHALMGPDYAYVEVDQFGSRRLSLPGIVEAVAIVFVALLAIAFGVAWRRARLREDNVNEELETIHAELNEVRASKHLIETILTQVKCGMDIVNESNEIVYATPGIEHHYGPWRGKRCYEYYWGSSKPCKHCTKRAAREHRKDADPYAESCHVTLQEDTHPIGKLSEMDSQGKLLQVPFYDENGRWLYARVHLPPEETLVKLEAEGVTASQG